MSIERRVHPRVKIHVPIEILPRSSDTPLRGETCDVSLGGCYVETLFPLQTGIDVEVRLRAGEATLIALGKVRTCHPQVGNGIQFVRMLPEDCSELSAFIEAMAAKDESVAMAEPAC